MYAPYQLLPYARPEHHSTSSSQLERFACAASGASRPGGDVLADPEHAIVGIQKNDIQWVAHPEGMHAPAGLDQQGLCRARRERLATQQATQTRPGVGGMPDSRHDAFLAPVERAHFHKT